MGRLAGRPGKDASQKSRSPFRTPTQPTHDHTVWDTPSIQPESFTPSMVLQLQRTIGNQAVQRLLGNRQLAADRSGTQLRRQPAAMSVAPTSSAAAAAPQSHIDVDRAIRLNARLRRRYGWDDHVYEIVEVLQQGGFLPPAMSPGEALFAEGVAAYQAANGLAEDGIIGRNTWGRLRQDLHLGDERAPASPPAAATPASETPAPGPATEAAPQQPQPTATETTESGPAAPAADLAVGDTSDSDMQKYLDALGSASQGSREDKAKELVNFAREQITSYPALVEQFKAQSGMSDEEKVRILGEVAAAVGKMEFLLGSIFHEGSDKEWEGLSPVVDEDGKPVYHTSGKYKGRQKMDWNNRGFMVDRYTGMKESSKDSAGPWCTMFATTVRSMVTGERSVGSGYKVGEGKYHDTSGRGGKLVGNASTRKASADKGSNYNPWADLRERLSEADGSKEEILKNFLEEIGMTPQAGDILVLRRSTGALANSFTTKGSMSSHTALIESFSGHVIHTIEGNSGQKVTGKTYDLANEKDVEEIVFISRPGLDTNMTVSKASEKAAAEGAKGDITRETLLAPVMQINNLLKEYAAEKGYIKALAPGAADTVSSLSKANKSSSQT